MSGIAHFVVCTVRQARHRPMVWVLPVLIGVATAAHGQDYGGPYPIVEATGKPPNQPTLDKIAEFDALRDPIIGWNSSVAKLLDRTLFVDSIEGNRRSDAPHAKRYQRYNYVVKDGEIIVAAWTTTGIVKHVCKRAPTSAQAYLGAKILKGAMVNIFPEDTSLPNSPTTLGDTPKACESTTSSGRTTGVLDGHSKHFMLVQGPGTKLSDYKPSSNSGAAWAQKKVDYAGEIIVDVKNCYYIINQGSGTYQPNGGTPKDGSSEPIGASGGLRRGSNGDFAFLVKVAKLFADTLKTPPAAVWDTRTSLLIPTIRNPANNLQYPTIDAPGGEGMMPLDCGNVRP